MKPLSLHGRLKRVDRGVKGFVVVMCVLATHIAWSDRSPDTIGIFDLRAIRTVPLDPEILSKTKEGDINIEQIRFTAVPGVRMVATITYKEGAKGAPGYAFVELFKVKPLVAEAKSGFVGIVVEPPTGNTDPKKLESVGGPVYPQPFDFNSQFLEDKNKSYIHRRDGAIL